MRGTWCRPSLVRSVAERVIARHCLKTPFERRGTVQIRFFFRFLALRLELSACEVLSALRPDHGGRSSPVVVELQPFTRGVRSPVRRMRGKEPREGFRVMLGRVRTIVAAAERGPRQ